MHDKHTELEKLVTTKMFTEVESMGDALDYSVELQLFLAMAQEEHVTKYKEVFKAGKELLDAIAILSQRRLPRSLFPDQRIEGILAQVDKMVRLRYPDYELAANFYFSLQRHGIGHILSRQNHSLFSSNLPSVYKRL